MDGILSVIKPAGMTSFDVVAYIRNRLGHVKAGHTGTLDPAACGLLILCIGKATKMSGYLTVPEKTYLAEMKLGTETDTLDSTGKVLSRSDFVYDRKKLEDVLNCFTGEILQKPPMYSAVKINGKRLYESARKGIDIEREERPVYIKNICITEDSDPSGIMLRITSSKGTYIRSLIADAGTKYGCGAHMGFLLRVSEGPFCISGAHTIEEIAAAAERGETEKYMTSLEDYFRGHDHLFLNDIESQAFIHGAFIDMPGLDVKSGYAIFNAKEKFLGIGETIRRGAGVCLKAKRLV